MKQIKYFFFPRRCYGCGEVVYPDQPFCENCNVEKCRVPYPKCFGCGETKSRCKCSEEEKRYTTITAPFYYENEISNCIKNFKFKGYTDNGDYLADEMIKSISEDFQDIKIDAVVSVALSEKRKRQRGFSQTDYLAEKISEKINVPFCRNALIKVKETIPQVELGGKERKTNLVGTFEVNKDVFLKGKTVLLCDDVKTTGSTLNECAKVLKRAGVKEIVCITAAISKSKITMESN